MSSIPTNPSSKAIEPRNKFFNDRSRRQLGLFLAGAGFLGASMAITRRSIVRRYKASIPKFYQPNNRPGFEVNGALEAVEALNMATINVLSAGMMVTGGLLWAFDIASMEDLRRKVRKNMSHEPSPEDKEAEEQIKEWMTTVLARDEFKHLKGQVQKENPELAQDKTDKKS